MGRSHQRGHLENWIFSRALGMWSDVDELIGPEFLFNPQLNRELDARFGLVVVNNSGKIVLRDEFQSCEKIRESGLCLYDPSTLPKFMATSLANRYCPKSCGLCTSKALTAMNLKADQMRVYGASRWHVNKSAGTDITLAGFDTVLAMPGIAFIATAVQ